MKTIGQPRRVAVALRIDEAFPHHYEVLRGIHRYAREHLNWTCIIDEHPDYTSRRNESSARYDGVIARVDSALHRQLSRDGVPLVNTWYQHAQPGLPGVYSDTKSVSEMVAEHLLDRGFRQFFFLGVRGYRQSAEIGQFFAQCIAAQGCKCEIYSHECGSCEDRKYWSLQTRFLDNLLDSQILPAAVFCHVPCVARLLITRCHNRGWRVPQDIAIVCLYNHEIVVELPPQISCVDNQYDRIGYEAAALLDQLMDGSPPPDKPLLVQPKNIVARESTDYFAVEDEVVAAALQFISLHLEKRLSVEQIAREVAVSPRSLQRRFESVLNRPISDEIRRMRLEMAKRMLGEESIQINQIARTTGFNTAVTMNQVFQRELGMSPGAYRKLLLGSQLTPIR